MDEQRGTQKQIAKRYEDKVDSRNTRTPWRRTRFWISVLLPVGAIAAIYYGQGKTPPAFFNTGPLSRHHSALSKLSNQLPELNLQNDCMACHQAETSKGSPLTGSRFMEIVDERFHKGAPSFERIDKACLDCHTHLTPNKVPQHLFHEPNVVENRSCSACHMEHQGPDPMKAVASSQCASCHNNREIMRASADFGKKLPPTEFRLNPKVANPTGTRPIFFQLPRPAEGYTRDFASFHDGHPPFQVEQQKRPDPNQPQPDRAFLRFNHLRHFEPDINPVEGKKLDCAYCHKAEPDGRYMQRMTFQANCQACHSLQLDVRNPDLQVPHGDAQLVRTFLRTLPAQYAELARLKRGMTSESKIRDFTATQVRQLLTQFPSAEELERAVFFTESPYKAAAQSPDRAIRAQYTGCAFCHEVKQVKGVSYPMAEVTAPILVDRWMPHAHFSHSKHEGVMSCSGCHKQAASSKLTSDVLMPTHKSCTDCHNPKGSAMKVSECTTCHVYHAPDLRAAAPVTASTVSFKQMLLGRGP